MMLEVMMADHPDQPHPPTFSSNAGMVMHVLKSNPVLRELEHVQVDGLGIAYLFFYEKQGHQGLGQDATDAVQTHVEEAFSEWISHSTHFTIMFLHGLQVPQCMYEEGLGAVLSQKQSDGWYHLITFGRHSMTPS